MVGGMGKKRGQPGQPLNPIPQPKEELGQGAKQRWHRLQANINKLACTFLQEYFEPSFP